VVAGRLGRSPALRALKGGHGERLRRRNQPQLAPLASDEISVWGQLPALGVARLAELELHQVSLVVGRAAVDGGVHRLLDRQARLTPVVEPEEMSGLLPRAKGDLD
jgi:hypothetical protein